MSKTETTLLDIAFRAICKLPESAQEAIAHEVMEQVEDFSTPDRSPERQAIIKERMSKPRDFVSRDDFMTMLRQYNPSL